MESINRLVRRLQDCILEIRICIAQDEMLRAVDDIRERKAADKFLKLLRQRSPEQIARMEAADRERLRRIG